MQHICCAGLNAQRLNNGIDFAISKSKAPIEFTDKKGERHELVTEFATTVWLKYCASMVSHTYVD